MTPMRALTARELLSIWERGLAQSPVERALELLAAVCPEASRESLAALSVGQRDARLLRLRELLFGPLMAASAGCACCGGRLEMTLEVSELLAGGPAEPEGEIFLCVGEYVLRLRLPNSQDVLVAARQADFTASRRVLLESCLLSASCAGEPASGGSLPQEIIAAAGERMAEADPLADIQMVLTCPHCGHRWKQTFDIVAFLWSEIEAWACRMLRDVHTLAAAYGWGERDILALSPVRRQFYLEMVGE
jgi:hypothetical protein